MNRKLVFLILLIFCSGMLLGCVSASHTYHKGGYSFTVSDNQYKKIQAVKNGKDYDVNYYIKTKQSKVVKIPKYASKKVTKTKWVHKTVWVGTEYSDGFGNVYKKTMNKNYLSNYKGGWKYYKSFYKENRKSGVCKYYSVLKKKVKYTDTVKVKTGYKKVKCPVYASIAPGNRCVGVCFTVEKGDYFDFISKLYYL